MNINNTQDAAKNLIDIANILNSIVTNKNLLPLLPNQHQAKALDKLYAYEKQINLIELNLNQYQDDNLNILDPDSIQLINQYYGLNLNNNINIKDAKKIVSNTKPIPYTATDLVKNLISDKSSVSSLLQKLEKRGLINRQNNQIDNRIKDLSLTKNGFEICDYNDKVYESLAQYLNFPKEVIDSISVLSNFLNTQDDLILTNNVSQNFHQDNANYENRHSTYQRDFNQINNNNPNQKW